MVSFKGTRAELRQSLSDLPAVLAGHKPDTHGFARAFLGHIANAVLEEIRFAYRVKSAGGTGSDGIRWPPLAEETLARRARKGLEHTDILVEYGDLFESLTPGTGPHPSGAENQVFRTEPGAVVVGTAVPYAEYHQTGVPGRMPARPIVPPDGELPPAWERAIEERAAEVLPRLIEELLQRVGKG